MRSSVYLFPALIIAVALMSMNWVGYDGSDDHSYALAAADWLNHFPYVASDHWGLRHPVVLPVALSLSLLGPSEFALALPNCLYFIGFIAVNYYFIRSYIDSALAPFAAVLLAVTPVFVVQSTYINDDVVELFFVSLSFWLFIAGRERARENSRFIWVGIAAALAFMTRETSVALLIFYGFCFLLSPGVPRSRYFLIGAAFLMTIGLENAFLYAMTGDILHRYRIDATHDVVDRVLEVARATAEGGVLDSEGNLSLSVWIDPAILLFVSQKFGPLFYLALPGGLWACFGRSVPREHHAVKLLGGLLITWVLFISLSFPILYLAARYYVVSAWAGVVIVAYVCWIAYRRTGRLWASGVMVAVLCGANALSLYLENTNPRFAERALIRYLRVNPGVIHTDPDTANRANLLLQFAHLTDRVSSTPAVAGDLVAYSPLNLDLCRIEHCKFDVALYERRPDWIEIERMAPRPRRLGTLLRVVNAEKVIPTQIMQKIEMPVPGIVIYRVP